MSEQQDVPCPDPNQIVTRQILDEGFAAFWSRVEARFASKDELRASSTVLQDALAAFESRVEVQFQELRAQMANVPTREDLSREIRAMTESFLAQTNAVHDPFRDLPTRTTALETSSIALESRVAALEVPKRVTRPRRKPTRTKRNRRR